MRLLLFSDLHCDLTAARDLARRSQDVDVVLGAGDFCSMRQRLQPVIDVLAAITRPAILVPGNSESVEELRAACRSWPSAEVLHGSGTEIGGMKFWGIGGAIPVTPFGDWSYDFSEDQGRQLLENCPAMSVIVSHSPPRGAVDQSSRGQSLGSTALAEAIRRLTPVLVVCGHIHDCAGQTARLDESPIVNAGPKGVVWEIGDCS